MSAADSDHESELDLTSELDPADRSATLEKASYEIKTSSYSPAAHRESVRGVVAILVLSLFAVLVLGALLSAIFADEKAWKQVADSLGLLLSPVVALVGAVTGFYYGEKAGKSV